MSDVAMQAFLIARKSDEAERLFVLRCQEERHWQAAAYRLRGTVVYGVPKLRLSPQTAELLGVPRRIESQAWLGAPPPHEILCGCEHWLGYIQLEQGGYRITREAWRHERT